MAVCACERVQQNYLNPDGGEIRFEAVNYLQPLKTDLALDTLASFGMSAVLNADGQSYDYFDNVEISYSTDRRVWAATPAIYWPKSSSYSMDFQCYHPYSATPWCEWIKGESGDTLATPSAVRVGTTDTTDPNYDLMYSDKSVDRTAAGGAVPLLFHHALASVNVGVNVVRSNDAVVLDAGGRYTYVEWVPGDPLYDTTPVSYIVPIGKDANDLEGIPGQEQKFGYRLKNAIQNVWICTLKECEFVNVATEGTLSMPLAVDGSTWTEPENGVWTIPSSGAEGVAAHSNTVTYTTSDFDVEVPPNMRSTVHTFPVDIHIIPQDLNWSPLTTTNNQKLRFTIHVRQFHCLDHTANDADDVNASGNPTGDANTFDYRDIYQYETNDDGSFKAWKTQDTEIISGYTYPNMVWREGLTPTYEYDVTKEVYLYDASNFAEESVPQYWKMNTKTVYILKINFAGAEISFLPSVQVYSDVEGGGGILID